MQPDQAQKPVLKTWKPTVAGILEIVEAGVGIIAFFVLVIGAIVVSAGSTWAGITQSDISPLTFGALAAILVATAVVVLVFAGLEIAAGISALQRKRWGLALAGSILAALPMNVLGILAIIFLALSKDEFV